MYHNYYVLSAILCSNVILQLAILTKQGDYSIVHCRETRTKRVMNVSSDGELLTYNQTRLFVFNQETTRAGLQENDTICTINLPLVVSLVDL